MGVTKKFEIILNNLLCKGCGICAAFCPKSVFTRDEEGKPMATNGTACIGCKMCEVRCPDFAIRVTGGK